MAISLQEVDLNGNALVNFTTDTVPNLLQKCWQ